MSEHKGAWSDAYSIAELLDMIRSHRHALQPGQLGESVDKISTYIATLKAQRDELLAVLNKLRRDHATCEDSWYSCPKSGEYLNKDDGDRCTCGADEHNAIIDAAIANAERPVGC